MFNGLYRLRYRNKMMTENERSNYPVLPLVPCREPLE